MAKAIETTSKGTIGHAMLARTRAGVPEQLDKVVHDGDTINVAADGNFGVRFLGVDAPEVSFTLPDNPNRFVGIGDPRWTEFLTDPFASPYPPLRLRSALHAFLLTRLDKTTAPNHAHHAAQSTTALRDMVGEDIVALGHTAESFRFRMAFAHEILDRYGRLLCYINREQPRGIRPPTYNERLLSTGHVVPYFIWPNVNPFIPSQGLAKAVPAPGTARELAETDNALRRARESVQAARAQGLGVWQKADTLRLLPFELRYLAGRRPPDRYVVDLSDEATEVLHPQEYFRIPNAEDRLFINAEHAPLFAEKGWHIP